MNQPKSNDTSTTPIAGRILVVEDNYFVAEDLKVALERMGLEVVGPAPSVKKGISLVADDKLIGAILDINIKGGTSVTIAEALEQRGTPFFFVTGYGSPQALPAHMKSVTRMSKPVDDESLRDVVYRMFGRDPGSAAG